MKTYSFVEAIEQPSIVTRLRIMGMASKEFVPRLHEFTALESLEIEYSDLSDLPEIPLPTLRRLILTLNRLTRLPVAITKWQNLEVLSIEERNLEHLPDQLCELKQLNFFKLTNPKLKDATPLAKAFAHWPHLEFLGLSSCAFETLSPSIRHLKALKKLFLNKMPNLVELPDVFEELPNLEVLTVYIGGLTSLPKSISSSKKLKQLTIMHCPISTLPTSLPESLEELVIAGTRITSVPAKVFQHPKLKEINFAMNQIKEVQVPTRYRMTPFDIIDLSSNAIDQLPDEFFKLPVKELRIARNPLTKNT